MKGPFFLAGDIGGTKTILALFSWSSSEELAIYEKIYSSREWSDFYTLLNHFLAGCPELPDSCVLAVAGPVFTGEVKVTKLDWHLSEKELRGKFAFKNVRLINDLVATAHAIPSLTNNNVLHINPGEKKAGGPIAVLAPGTGLGEVFLLRTSQELLVCPSEGGHALFAPADHEQMRLLEFVSEHIDQVTYDFICSGLGIPYIYRFLKEKEGINEPAWFAESLALAADPTPVIFSHAEGGSSTQKASIASRTLEIFSDMLAVEAANFCLKILASGGIYFAGGLSPRLIFYFQQDRFFRNFYSRRLFDHYLKNVPLSIVLNPKAALLGAASFLRNCS